MARHGAVAGWGVDDTGIPQKGQQSVGVARQYCSVLGKQDTGQVAVSLTLANEAGSVPAVYRLYRPESWANDSNRRRAAGVPKEVTFQPTWQIALAMIDGLHTEGVPPAPIWADAGYGVGTAFRDALTERQIPYVVGIRRVTTVWPPGREPWPPKRRAGTGRPFRLVYFFGRTSPSQGYDSTSLRSRHATNWTQRKSQARGAQR